MGDEIQITVIATGFEKDNEIRNDIVADTWRKRSNSTSTTSSISSESNSNDLDIPTFLRKNKGLGK